MKEREQSSFQVPPNFHGPRRDSKGSSITSNCSLIENDTRATGTLPPPSLSLFLTLKLSKSMIETVKKRKNKREGERGSEDEGENKEPSIAVKSDKKNTKRKGPRTKKSTQ